MRKLIYTPAAAQDLDDIFEYTFMNWGFEQAQRYFESLIKACESLVDNPEKALRVDEIRLGYKRWVVGSHAIYFTATTSQLKVIRILGEAMSSEINL